MPTPVCIIHSSLLCACEKVRTIIKKKTEGNIFLGNPGITIVFPQRNDGEYPGSSEWWHCSGGDLDKYLDGKNCIDLDGTTVMLF